MIVGLFCYSENNLIKHATVHQALVSLIHFFTSFRQTSQIEDSVIVYTKEAST